MMALASVELETYKVYKAHVLSTRPIPCSAPFAFKSASSDQRHFFEESH